MDEQPLSSDAAASPPPPAPRPKEEPLPTVFGCQIPDGALIPYDEPAPLRPDAVTLHACLQYKGQNDPPLMWRVDNPVETAKIPYTCEPVPLSDLQSPASSSHAGQINLMVPHIWKMIEVASRSPDKAVTVFDILDMTYSFICQPVPAEFLSNYPPDVAEAVFDRFNERQKVHGSFHANHLSWVDWLGGCITFFGLFISEEVVDKLFGGQVPTVETYVLVL